MPKKADTKKSTAKKKASKKIVQKKTSAKKTPAKKTPAKKAQSKKTPAKKVAVKKATVKKAAAKKRTSPISSYKGRKGEKYMSAAMKKHFNAVLIDWREHLKEEMQKTFDHLKNKGESYADPIDRASQDCLLYTSPSPRDRG